jgi:hypothetical protein
MASGLRSGGRGSSRPPLLSLALIAAAIVAVTAAAYLLTPVLSPARSQPSGTSRPLDVRNVHDAALKNDYLFDDGYETCQALGLRNLARTFGVPATPSHVALAFAHRFDPQDRPGPYAGCLKGLSERTAIATDARAQN